MLAAELTIALFGVRHSGANSDTPATGIDLDLHDTSDDAARVQNRLSLIHLHLSRSVFSLFIFSRRQESRE